MFIWILFIIILIYIIFVMFKSYKKNEFGMFWYNFFKYLLRPIFKFYYPYKVNNKIELKEDESIIICGNHLHILDQCLPLLIIDRPVHYMAKKEYFDNKKTRWFFKIVGCIPVNRSIKDENAKEKAIEVLNNKLALGIFPEGTRNQISCKDKELNELYELYKNDYSLIDFKNILIKNKVRLSEVNLLKDILSRNIINEEEYKKGILDASSLIKKLYKENKITKEEYESSLLLKLKYGAVSMASKTNSTIVPVAITGNYHFRSKDLTVTFGEPFKVNDMDLEEANNKLFNEITSIIINKEK